MPKNKISRSVFSVSALTIALLILLVTLLHALSYQEPYDRDECIYSVAGRELLRGRGLYTDVWDIKPPGVYLTYAGAIALFGYGRPAIFSLAVLASVVTMVGVFLAVNEGTKNKLAALWAASFWTVVACSADVQANQPNSEVFLNALTAFALWAYFKSQGVRGEKQETRWLLATGTFWALATYFKQVALVPAVCLAFCAGAYVASGRLKWKVRPFLLILAPILGLWGLTALFFLVRGSWWDFVYINFTYLQRYGRGFTWMEHQSFGAKLIPPRVLFLWPLAAISLIGAGTGWKSSSRVWLGWFVLLVMAEIEIFLPGQFFAHYYQLDLVPVVLGAGLGLDALSRVKTLKGFPVSSALAALAFLILASGQWYCWSLSPAELSNYKYGPQFETAYQDGQAVKALLRPGEGLYLYAGEPEYYFWAEKSPPSGMVSNMLDETPDVPELTARTLASLRRDPPQLVIVDVTFPVTPISDFLRQKLRGDPASWGAHVFGSESRITDSPAHLDQLTAR